VRSPRRLGGHDTSQTHKLGFNSPNISRSREPQPATDPVARRVAGRLEHQRHSNAIALPPVILRPEPEGRGMFRAHFGYGMADADGSSVSHAGISTFWIAESENFTTSKR
jgi:hypothetical protein